MGPLTALPFVAALPVIALLYALARRLLRLLRAHAPRALLSTSASTGTSSPPTSSLPVPASAAHPKSTWGIPGTAGLGLASASAWVPAALVAHVPAIARALPRVPWVRVASDAPDNDSGTAVRRPREGKGGMIELLPTTALPPPPSAVPLVSPPLVSPPRTPAPYAHFNVGEHAHEGALVDVSDREPQAGPSSAPLYPQPYAYGPALVPAPTSIPAAAIFFPAPAAKYPGPPKHAFSTPTTRPASPAIALARLATTPPPPPHRRSRSLGGVPVRRLSGGAVGGGSGLRNSSRAGEGDEPALQSAVHDAKDGILIDITPSPSPEADGPGKSAGASSTTSQDIALLAPRPDAALRVPLKPLVDIDVPPPHTVTTTTFGDKRPAPLVNVGDSENVDLEGGTLEKAQVDVDDAAWRWFGAGDRDPWVGVRRMQTMPSLPFFPSVPSLPFTVTMPKTLVSPSTLAHNVPLAPSPQVHVHALAVPIPATGLSHTKPAATAPVSAGKRKLVEVEVEVARLVDVGDQDTEMLVDDAEEYMRKHTRGEGIHASIVAKGKRKLEDVVDVDVDDYTVELEQAPRAQEDTYTEAEAASAMRKRLRPMVYSGTADVEKLIDVEDTPLVDVSSTSAAPGYNAPYVYGPYLYTPGEGAATTEAYDNVNANDNDDPFADPVAAPAAGMDDKEEGEGREDEWRWSARWDYDTEAQDQDPEAQVLQLETHTPLGTDAQAVEDPFADPDGAYAYVSVDEIAGDEEQDDGGAWWGGAPAYPEHSEGIIDDAAVVVEDADARQEMTFGTNAATSHGELGNGGNEDRVDLDDNSKDGGEPVDEENANSSPERAYPDPALPSFNDGDPKSALGSAPETDDDELSTDDQEYPDPDFLPLPEQMSTFITQPLVVLEKSSYTTTTPALALTLAPLPVPRSPIPVSPVALSPAAMSPTFSPAPAPAPERTQSVSQTPTPPASPPPGAASARIVRALESVLQGGAKEGEVEGGVRKGVEVGTTQRQEMKGEEKRIVLGAEMEKENAPPPAPLLAVPAPMSRSNSNSSAASYSPGTSAPSTPRPAWSRRADAAPPLGLAASTSSGARRVPLGNANVNVTMDANVAGVQETVEEIHLAGTEMVLVKPVTEKVGEVGETAVAHAVDTSPAPLERTPSVPGAFPDGSAPSPAPPAGAVATTSAAVIQSSSLSKPLRARANTHTWVLPSPARLAQSSPLELALAMQLRPGLGAGADPAWMVRFLMAVYGWVVVSIAGGF